MDCRSGNVDLHMMDEEKENVALKNVGENNGKDEGTELKVVEGDNRTLDLALHAVICASH